MRRPNIFEGDALDRAGLARKDEAWVAARLADPASRVLPLWRANNFVHRAASDSAEGGGDVPPVPLLLDVATARRLAPDAAPILLGIAPDGAARFALDVSRLAAPLDDIGIAGLDTGDLRDLAGALAAADSAMMAQARSLVHWHATHRFCAKCGGPTASREAGHMRACLNDSCKAHHFPRTDPAVIMLVTRGPRCLLARRSGNPLPMYSTLAGFVEPGESLEEAVVREVLEEVGVRVIDVRYRSSQPWPFPAQLMLGFHAETQDETVRLQDDEIADARWFARADVARMLAEEAAGTPGPTRLPRPISIARRLVEEWLHAGD